MKKKILIIGFPNSVHTLNWINSVDLTKFKVFFFPSTSSNLSCINDKRVTYYEDHYEISKLKIFLYRFLSLLSLDKFFFTPKIYIKQIIHNKYLLKDYIFFLQPDIIHSLEIQHSGYLTYDAINKSGAKLMKYNKDWELIEKEYDSENPTKYRRNTQPSLACLSLSDVLIIRNWIDYAKGIGDPSAQLLNHTELVCQKVYKIAENRVATYVWQEQS